MRVRHDESLSYCIFDPTGNITALVTSVVAVAEQPSVAARIMQCHPEVEQVGFVRLASDVPGVQAELRMAGGEFCGNATMSAAALYLLRGGQEAPEGSSVTLRLKVSGAAQPVEVLLTQTALDACDAGICMPSALGIDEVSLTHEGLSAAVPVVRMEGISHAVIEQGSPYFSLLDDRGSAERAVRGWCSQLGVDGLGLMFLAGERLTPLVYVPDGDTVFWENSCASGSAATGMYLSFRAAAPASLVFHEPGGILRVESDSAEGQTWLYGSARLAAEYRGL